jgi:hypothetical protein
LAGLAAAFFRASFDAFFADNFFTGFARITGTGLPLGSLLLAPAFACSIFACGLAATLAGFFAECLLSAPLVAGFTALFPFDPACPDAAFVFTAPAGNAFALTAGIGGFVAAADGFPA